MVKMIMTKVQNDAIDFEAEHILIKGAPGSGKTTVLLYKLLKLMKTDPEAKILMITYNKTLTKYVKDFFESKGEATEGITISTFHGWGWRLLLKMNGRKPNSSPKTVDEAFEEIYSQRKKVSKHRFYKEDKFKKFLEEEIQWIKGQGIGNLEDYKQVKRSGRNARLSQEDRKEVYRFLEAFDSLLAKKGIIPFDDYANILSSRIDEIPSSFKYDFILIDEAQDLNQSELSLLRKLNPKSLVVSADMGQKIYKTDFTWKSVGINVVGGRTKSLEEMHRSCVEVVKLAQPLYKKNLSIGSNKQADDKEELLMPTRESGIPPELHVYKDTTAEFQGVAASVNEIWRNSKRDITIGILVRNVKSLYALKRVLPPNLPVEIINKDDGNSLEPGIKLVTMHSAKGLEFDVVFIVRLTEGNLPYLTKEMDKEDVEEAAQSDRRLLYVSMTRAKHQLVMTTYGDKRSRYLDELNPEDYKLKRK
ncbi:3'-5' exonuclease [Planococcus sp. SIMBA_143]